MSKIVLITGASSGIGRATALELLRAGHTVYGGARRVDNAGFGLYGAAEDVPLDQARYQLEVNLFGDVTANGVRELSGHGPYRDLAEGLAESTESLYREHSKASDPSVVAAIIREAIETASPRPRYPVGYMARPLLALNRILPARLFDRVATSQIT